MDARLEPYRVVVSFLGEALGPDYEVVLHDLTSEDGTIVAIVNNHISGRTEGAPLSNMALRFIQERMYEKQDYLAGYQGASQAKGRLRSSTMFIKDGSELIGMLCVNKELAAAQELHLALRALLDRFNLSAPPEDSPSEDLSSPLESVMHSRIAEIISREGTAPAHMSMQEKIRVVHKLDADGILMMKGAVAEIADQLSVSVPTIYRYLNKTQA